MLHSPGGLNYALLYAYSIGLQFVFSYNRNSRSDDWRGSSVLGNYRGDVCTVL